MTTVKKLAFCSTCTVILLGFAPKAVADDTLKDVMGGEKKIEQEVGNTVDALNKTLEMIPALVKFALACPSLYNGAYAFERAIKDDSLDYPLSEAFKGVMWVTAGGSVLFWGLCDIYKSIFKKSGAKEKTRRKEIPKRY